LVFSKIQKFKRGKEPRSIYAILSLSIEINYRLNINTDRNR